MRVIDAAALLTMESPIRHVMQYIPNATVHIAPERTDEFCKIFTTFTIEYLDVPKWDIRVDVEKKHISISRKACELFWATALYGWRLYEVKAAYPNGGYVFLEPGSFNEKVTRLFRWALKTTHKKENTPWPDNLPSPLPKSVLDSCIHVADEICLGAIAFSMHHELSHLKLEHSWPSTIEQEKDADRESANWILAMASNDKRDNGFVKRILSISVALTAIVANEMCDARHSGATHPAGYNRLFHVLDQCIGDEPDHYGWEFSLMVLMQFLANAGYNIGDKPEFKTARDGVDHCVELLSRESPKGFFPPDQ